MNKYQYLLCSLLFICSSFTLLSAQDCTPNTPCDDGNDCTINDTFDDNCFCSGTLLDTDGDGSPDCFDLCPNDPNKDLPGACGCGTPDEDRDGDFQVDCFDACPDDPNKILPGICGCGTPDDDDDGDLIANCLDLCPNSTNNSDSDGDGVCDEFDQCPGGDDTIDLDGNGTPDACEDCDPVVGSPCNDNNDCTTNDRIVANCNCTGTLIDSDGDNVCDTEDLCPGGDDNVDENNNGVPDFCENNATGDLTITSCPNDITYTVPYNNPLDGDDVSWSIAEATTTCVDGEIILTSNIGLMPFQMVFVPTEVMNEVRYEFTDNCGNTEVCMFSVFLESEIGISFGPQDINLTAAEGETTARADWNFPVAETSCTSSPQRTQTAGLMPGDLFPIGTTVVTYRFADNCDNEIEYSFNVTVTAATCTTAGTACDDGDPCTTNDLIDENCNCIGTFTDSDNDGVCDANDVCPTGDDNIDENNNGTPDACEEECEFEPWAPCDDGDPCTIQDEINDDCVCRGLYNDTDGDGVCDADDICPGGDDFADADNDGIPDACDTNEEVCNEIGNSCDDGNPCTTNDLIDENCNCIGTFADSDNDGVCDAEDICPTGDDNADIDGDGIPDACDDCDERIGTACDDGDACTINDTYNTDCQCVGTFADSDNDGVCDAEDICPTGDDNADIDGDGIPDACDDCDERIGTACDDGDACTTNDTYNTNCQCIGTFADSDNDGICDAEDICPTGDDNADIDGDGIPDTCDDCDERIGTACDDGDACTINDTYNTDCQCVGTFVDSDNDGVCDANDTCPNSDDNIDVDNDGIADGCDDCIAVIGAACDDGDMMTVGDRIDESCNCIGAMLDSDIDGVPDKDDICPGGDDNLDSDGDGIPNFCDKCDDCESSLDIQCEDQNINLPSGATVATLDFVEPTTSLHTCGPCMTHEIEGYRLLDTYQGHRYYVSNQLVTWWDAVRMARAQCGYVAVINSELENQLLVDGLRRLQDPTITSVFIGLHDKSVEGVFAWINGEPLTYTNWNLPLAEMNMDNRDKVRLLNNGKWDIELNTHSRHFILELPCINYTIAAGDTDGVFPVGTTQVTYQATSICGDTDACTFNVNVENGVDPYAVDFNVNTAVTFASLFEEEIQVTWSITNSYVTDRFMIYRSVNNGEKERIGWFKNDQNSRSLTRYSFIDEDPLEGDIDYHIEQVFDNESKRMLPLASIDYQLPATAFNIFPNPVDQQLLIHLRHFENKAANILIYNHLGILVEQRQVEQIDSKPVELLTANYEDGIYRLVILIEGQRMLSRNFVVTKW